MISEQEEKRKTQQPKENKNEQEHQRALLNFKKPNIHVIRRES